MKETKESEENCESMAITSPISTDISSFGVFKIYFNEIWTGWQRVDSYNSELS